jgi:hypothetical protein
LHITAQIVRRKPSPFLVFWPMTEMRKGANPSAYPGSQVCTSSAQKRPGAETQCWSGFATKRTLKAGKTATKLLPQAHAVFIASPSRDL